MKIIQHISLLLFMPLIFVYLLWPINSHAQIPAIIQPQEQNIIIGENGIVSEVISGDIFILNSGLKVKLASVNIPKKELSQPLADAAKNALAKLVKGKQVQLYYTNKKRDRYGRAEAQITILENGDEKWLQIEMLKLGLARVYTWPKTEPEPRPRQNQKPQNINIKALYEAENMARTGKLGIWDSKKTNGFYDIRSPEPNALAQLVDSVQIVEGIIVKTAKARGTIYLNFGADYKTDFTIAIDKSAARSFKRADYDPLLLAGAKVRVRGYIELYGGPIIWLDDPARLQILD